MSAGVRIGIDARAADAVPTGLTTYAHELINALTRLDSPHSYVIIRRPDAGPRFVDDPRVEEVLVRGDASTPTLGGAVSRLGLDLYHSLHHFLPIGLEAKRVIVTLHDLIWIEHPRLIRGGPLAPITRTITSVYARAAIGDALRRSDHIVAITAHSRDRAVARFGISPDRTTIVHHGVAHDRFRPADQGEPDASQPYFLCVGNTKPYKNIPVAIEAFALCAAALPQMRLVIVGRGDSLVELQRLADRLGIADRVRFTGMISEFDLIALLRGAQALVFPSIVEGFGLPVLEAMATGCPVIASTCPAVGEVTGMAAILCDAARPDAFAAAMVRVATDASLRHELRASGQARAAAFTWQHCAQETLAVYDRVLGARRSAGAGSR